MAIKQEVNEYDFIKQFEDARPDNFTRAGLIALYNYLEQLSEDIGEDIELDVIAICCDYTEYEDIEEIQANYTDIESIEDLEQRTTVIEFDEGIIIQNY